MPMTSCTRIQYERSSLTTKFINLAEDGHFFELYKSHPYFVDVLEWVEGIRPLEAIRHNHCEHDFRRNILPALLKRLKDEGLLRIVGGTYSSVYSDVILKGTDCDPFVDCEIAASQIDTLLQRAFETHQAPKLDVVRTKASPEQIRDWRRKLIHIFEEIEDHDDPDGVPFVLNLLSLKETVHEKH
jgi:hypothetical protein